MTLVQGVRGQHLAPGGGFGGLVPQERRGFPRENILNLSGRNLTDPFWREDLAF
jgi:hypothetical protein